MRHPGHLPPNLPAPTAPSAKPSNITALRPRPDDLDYPPLLPANDARQERLDTIGFVLMMGLVYTLITIGLLALWLSSEPKLDVWQLLWSLVARWS